MSLLIPVVLSGGSGTRLWPLSRQRFPKQFQRVIGDDSMLSQTLERLGEAGDRALILANRTQVDALIAALPVARTFRIIAEPAARNTAPAIAAAALLSNRSDILVVMPSDHHIAQPDRFRTTLEVAVTAARAGKLVAFGIVPTRAETGYGYIVPAPADGPAVAIDRFVEKPELTEAEALIAAGALWNSGMFVFAAGPLIDELRLFEPELVQAVEASLKSAQTQGNLTILSEEFSASKSISVDNALMERTKQAVVVPLDAGWNDIGSWETLFDLGERDEQGNVAVGKILALDSHGNYLRSDGPLLAVSGVDDLIVVVTKDAVLVTRRTSAQDVRQIVEQLPEELA
jgi:mannose-1-phosphate guanylyltransferase/mannose-6-phosphate isomerase